jgi:uncharacterized membrane protein YedE/YeeE
MSLLINAIAGVVFGLGLLISGMTDPAKVQNFLDVWGTWDPSLAFVMGAAVAVTFLGYRIAFRRPRPLLASSFRRPSRTRVDYRAVLGAAIFGIGWGLSGFCPGPAVVSLALLANGALVFVPALLVGVILARTLTRPTKASPQVLAVHSG